MQGFEFAGVRVSGNTNRKGIELMATLRELLSSEEYEALTGLHSNLRRLAAEDERKRREQEYRRNTRRKVRDNA